MRLIPLTAAASSIVAAVLACARRASEHRWRAQPVRRGLAI